MSKQKLPQAKKLVISPEDLAKVEKLKSEQEKYKVDEYWYSLAELGYFYGWGAIQSVLNNDIDGETMMMLLFGARKLEARAMYANSKANFIGSATANSKNPVQAFNKATSDISKTAKADIS